jgi:predicted protein tyrosine phosphatase
LKHLLFICSQNKLRSPTAEAVFAGMPGIDVDSAGLNNDAIVPLSPEQVEWADLIFVMEKTHREKLHRNFKRNLNRQRVIVLGIPDNYEYMDPELVELLKARVRPYL